MSLTRYRSSHLMSRGSRMVGKGVVSVLGVMGSGGTNGKQVRVQVSSLLCLLKVESGSRWS